MPDNQTFLGDKPYGFVPLLDVCERTQGIDQHVFPEGTYSGKLGITMTLLSSLGIGDGHTSILEDGRLLHRQLRRNGEPAIPGSSVKGMVRSIAEAVSHACAPKLPDPWVRGLLRAFPARNQSQCDSTRALCPVCSLFGFAGRRESYRGKVLFGDFASDASIPVVLESILQQQTPFKNYPRPPHDLFGMGGNYGNERLYYCQACQERNCETCTKENYYAKSRAASRSRGIRFRGRKFYRPRPDGEVEGGDEARTFTLHEMMPTDTQLYGEVVFQALSATELSLLVFSLALDQSFSPLLGYAKAYGYGRIRLTLSRVDDLMRRYGRQGSLTRDSVASMAEDYATEAPEDIRNAITALREIL